MAGIDYSSLGKPVQRLKEGLEALRRDPESTLYRDGVIQRFEFTYGLCASMLQRFPGFAELGRLSVQRTRKDGVSKWQLT